MQPLRSALERKQAGARPSSGLRVRRQTAAQNAADRPATRRQHGDTGAGDGDHTRRQRTRQLDHRLIAASDAMTS